MSKASAVTFLRCTECGASVELRSAVSSQRVVCAHCGAAMDVRSGALLKVDKWRKAARSGPQDLRIGQRGRLRDVEYEIIGVVGRSERDYRWGEYLLFNPAEGIRWLLVQQGHWSFGGPLHGVDAANHPKIAAGDVHYSGTRFRRYHEGFADVFHASGEFPWRIRIGDHTRITDYVAPPQLLSLEKSNAERSWTLFEYLPVAEVERAFDVKLPAPRGITPHQPNAHQRNLKSFGIAAAALSILLWVAHRAATADFGNQQIVGTALDAPTAYGGHTVVVASFEVLGRPAPATLRSDANLKNSWLDLEYSMVNRESQEHFDIAQGLERYSGVDSDGSWSEGDSSKTTTFGPVPAGRYDLLLDAASGDASYASYTGDVSVYLTKGVSIHRIAWIAWLLIISVPVLMFWRSLVLEKNRWSGSEFSGGRS